MSVAQVGGRLVSGWMNVSLSANYPILASMAADIDWRLWGFGDDDVVVVVRSPHQSTICGGRQGRRGKAGEPLPGLIIAYEGTLYDVGQGCRCCYSVTFGILQGNFCCLPFSDSMCN